MLAAADGFRLIGADGAADGPPVRPAGMPERRAVQRRRVRPGRPVLGRHRGHRRPGRTGSLYRLDPDGSVTEVLGGVTESNGLGWSPDATVFYYTDSGEERSRVRAFGFDLDAARWATSVT